MSHRIHVLLATLTIAIAAMFAASAPAAMDGDTKAAAALTWRTCTPAGTAVFGNRIHIRCTTGVSGVFYYAVSTADPNRAARMLALWTAAIAAGHDVRILHDPADTSGTAIGCLATDCRMAVASEML